MPEMHMIDDSLCRKLHNILGQERFSHSCGVAATAHDLAPRWEVDAQLVHLAGWLHDYARLLPGPDLLAKASQYGLLVDEIENRFPALLHGRVGAELLREAGLCRDDRILSAISNHVTGDVEMARLDQLLFVCDMIEPGRNYPGVEELRSLAVVSPTECFARAMKAKIVFFLKRGFAVHPRSLALWNRLVLDRG